MNPGYAFGMLLIWSAFIGGVIIFSLYYFKYFPQYYRMRRSAGEWKRWLPKAEKRLEEILKNENTKNSNCDSELLQYKFSRKDEEGSKAEKAKGENGEEEEEEGKEEEMKEGSSSTSANTGVPPENLESEGKEEEMKEREKKELKENIEYAKYLIKNCIGYFSIFIEFFLYTLVFIVLFGVIIWLVWLR